MNTVQRGWVCSSLEEVTTLIKDGSHGTHIDVTDGIPFLSAKDVRDGQLLVPDNCRQISELDYVTIHKNYIIEQDDILLTVVGTIGRCYLMMGIEPRFSIQRSVAVIRPVGIEADYLYQFIRSEKFQKNLTNFVNASAQGGVYLGSLAKCFIDYPTDKPEQIKIAEVLSTVDQAIEQTEALIVKQQCIKTGLMQDLLTRGIDEHGNLRSEETHEFKDSPLGRIPVEWGVTELGELVEAVDPQPDHRTPAEVQDGVPYIGISDFRKDGSIDFAGARKISVTSYQKQKRVFQICDGDFVFGKIGTIGLPRRVPVDRKYALSANVILLKPHNTPSFVYWWMESPIAERLVELELHTTSQPAFGIQKMRSFKIPKPSKDERQKIGTFFDEFDCRKEADELALSKLHSLKTGLMHDLLTGKKRVTSLLKAEKRPS